MGTFRLWSDEIEAMRPEARAVIDAGQTAMTLDMEPAAASVAEQIAAARESMAVMTFLLDDTEERVIAGVPCRLRHADGTPRAIYLHFHGGGMISGSAGVMDIPNQMTAAECGVTVVSVEYRKGPEFPYPAGPDDGVAVAGALIDGLATELGSDRILIGGESAGGYMAAAVALRIRDELGAIDRVIGLDLTYGELDWSGNASHLGRRATDGFDVLSPDFLRLSQDSYLPGVSPQERRAPEISPVYAALGGLPPCFVAVGTCDHLFDDSIIFASRAAAAGVRVDLFVLPEMPHAFQMFDCGITRAWSAARAAWIQSIVA